VHYKEDQTQVTLSDSEAAEKPICDQSIGQKASTECIQRKQSSQLGDNSFAFWRDPAPS